MTDQVLPDKETGGETPPSQRRSTESEVAQAIDLGWRVAALHALTPTTIEPIAPVSPDMLLNRRSLSAADRLELEVRAIAGVAERARAPIAASRLAKLLRLTMGAGESAEGEVEFRDEIARLHVTFAKELWAQSDVSGKAYELGNFLSDSWNRIASPKVHRGDPQAELTEVFAPVRVERMKLLLDDLQSRVDPVAIHAVSSHLDDWCARVGEGAPAGGSGAAGGLTLEENVERLEPVERQTVIWRQLLTGDKEPEAWIGQAERAQVRDEFTRQLWSRYRRWWWVGVLLAIAAGGLGYWYATDSDAAKGVAASALAVLAMFGVTRASMTAALKNGARNWSELMWNRALAAVICRETSVVDELYPPPAESST
jgi:hypothetical protein